MMVREEREHLVDLILSDLHSRSTWDNRQSEFWQLRRHGLPRTRPPFPNASDVHIPLCDTAIEQLKPYYFAQLYTSDRLATFVPVSPLAKSVKPELIGILEEWFDFELKNRSNFEREIIRAVDYMLERGRGVLKIWYDEDERKLKFQAISPQYIIVPPSTIELQNADRIVHVMHYSVDAYLREEQFNHDEEVIRRIAGRGVRYHNEPRFEERMIAEGITHFRNDDEIVLWEVWRRVPEGWEVSTISPVDPSVEVRETFLCPYDFAQTEKHKPPLPPFVDFEYEIIGDQDWYAPRGIVELAGVYQQEMKKLIDLQNDYATFILSPLYKSDSMPPGTSLRLEPGSIVPGDVQPVPLPQLPFSVDKLILLFRDLAERRVAMPDYGMTQVRQPKEPRTATEISAILQFASRNIDLRMRIFRLSLARVYQLAWMLLRQFHPEGAFYWAAKEAYEIGPDILAAPFMVQPAGGVTGEPRFVQYQKAVNRFALFNGNPFINQGELVRTILEADDAGLVRRLYQDANQFAANEAEEQATEIAVMKIGYPAAVQPNDNHAVHLQVLVSYLQSMVQGVQQATQHEVPALVQHITAHLDFLKKQDPQAAEQFEGQIEALLQALTGANQEQGGQQ